MVKIIYGHASTHFNDLKIAGDFTEWQIESMQKRSEEGGQWEYEVDESKLPLDGAKVQFKFIDDQGNWFTDDNYAKEFDENHNENNVKFLKRLQVEKDHVDDGANSVDGDEDGDEDEVTKVDVSKDSDYEPATPAPSLRCQSRDTSTPKTPPVPSNNLIKKDDKEAAGYYKKILASIVAFFTSIFHSWFG